MKINGSELLSLHLIRSQCKYVGSSRDILHDHLCSMFLSPVLDKYLPGIIKINGLNQLTFTVCSVAKERNSVLLHHLGPQLGKPAKKRRTLETCKQITGN